MKSLLMLLIMIGASLHSTPATAQKSKLRPDRIQISYVTPKNPSHEALFQMLKERQVLEKFKEFLSPLRLPRALGLKLEGCDGVSNAWYENDAITVCYEYIDDILRNAPEGTTPAGVTRADAIVGPTLEVSCTRSGTPSSIISACQSWDARRMPRISLPAICCCSSQKAMRGD
jgi:hypothetical protein